MSQTSLTASQKREFVKDGFVVIKGAVPREMVDAARALIEAGMPTHEKRILAPPELATHPDVIGLFRNSCLAELMRNEMGRYPDVVSCQIAITPPHDTLRGRPFPHVDGSWSGPIPSDPDEIETVRGRPIDAEKWFGVNDEKKGSNDGLLWQDPEKRISLGSYTALVGIALNDQLEPGNGQFGVLRGTHDVVEASFRAQRDCGGVIGPEGPGWPRIRISEDGHPTLNGLPDMVRTEVYEKREHPEPSNQWPWPELTPVCLAAGDAVIALHSCPHTPTPNLGPNPRMNLYFRLRRWREGNPNEGTRRVGHGVSDHPDRGYYGQYLEHPPSYDPWFTSVEKLCDHWSEWDGLRDVVATTRDSRSELN